MTELEQARNIMHSLADEHGILDERVLAASVVLDGLIMRAADELRLSEARCSAELLFLAIKGRIERRGRG